METFSNYIFHPETRAWLDVMVWSAAQPHNVKEMVDACFGQGRKHLSAVWARDKMELGNGDYRECSILSRELTSCDNRQEGRRLQDLTSLWSQVSFAEPHSQYMMILLDDKRFISRRTTSSLMNTLGQITEDHPQRNYKRCKTGCYSLSSESSMQYGLSGTSPIGYGPVHGLDRL